MRTRPSVSRSALDSSPRSGEHERPHRAEDPTRPETWRVRFRLRMPQQRRASSASTRLQLRARTESMRAQAHARRLARRFEALRRVIADPRPAIANLARTLTSLGRTIARRISLARPSRSTSLGPIFASAMVLSQDASFSFPHDTS